MYYIDANNVIGYVDATQLGNVDAFQLFVSRVAGWARQAQKNCILISDAHHQADYQFSPEVRVCHPDGRDADGDECMLRIIEEKNHTHSATVVTNDKDLISDLQENGVKRFLSVEAFVDRLNNYSSTLALENEKPDPEHQTAAEIRYWEKQFTKNSE